jgi:ribosome-binding factor A
MPDPARARRLAKRISTIVASAIEYEIKDPRLTGVTITDAKMTGDLHDATLYYTVIGRTLADEPDFAGAAAALESAKGVLRTKVGAATPCPTRHTGWRICWLAHGPRMRIWPEFGRVPSTQVKRTRTVGPGLRVRAGT